MPIVNPIHYCDCERPMIRCDNHGCRCTHCGGMKKLKKQEDGYCDCAAPLTSPDEPDVCVKCTRPINPIQEPEELFRALLAHIGDDPNREGLQDTPARVAKAWKEWAIGYGMDPASVLKVFEDGAERVNELVIVHNIPVISKCEHHLADIIGIAHVGYIPNGRIVGLSKLARLVDVFGRRLQVQERLTNQIADTLEEHLKPAGVGVLIRAAHGCMSTRGVKIHGSQTTTSAMRGALRKEGSARAEFLTLCQMAEAQKGV